jgi:acyl-CoA reductase-like NAD-dependent aldehyde dehydrogenase
MLNIYNPATDDLIEKLPSDDHSSISRKYTEAKSAQKSWSTTPFKTRAKIVERFAHLLTERAPACAKILTSEVGKPLGQAMNEVKGTVGRVEFFLSQAEKRLAAQTVLDDQKGGMREVIGFEPLGVVANISAWNYPYFVGSNVFVPALLTGSAVLYKPSEFSALTGRQIAQLWQEAGLPAGLFQLIIGDGAVGNMLLEQPVDGVFFTGSYGTGKKIMDKVAGRMIRVQCELGGKDPVYIRPDMDPKAAAEAVADGAFYNTGQSCCAVERIYVHKDIHDRFVDAFVAFTKTFKVGDPMAEGTYIGPLTRKAQLGVLEEQVADAVKKGAKLLAGGKRRAGKGSFFEPTVLGDVNHTMSVMRDESFGPIIGIQKVKDDAEAVRLMNDTEYGLTAGVYTKDENAAESLLAEVNAGSVYWNCCDRVSPRLPWSGRGHSGIGATLSVLGIDVFLKPKAWHLRKPQ